MNKLHYYSLVYIDYEESAELIFVSKTKYTEEEFKNILEEAIQQVYQYMYNERTSTRCIVTFTYMDIMGGTQEFDIFIEYITKNSDLQPIIPEIGCDAESLSKPKLECFPDCIDKCTHDAQWKWFCCRYPDRMIEAGKELIELKKGSKDAEYIADTIKEMERGEHAHRCQL